MHIFHIIEQSTWQETKSGTLYEGDTLSINGFIHCCTFEQIEGVLLKWFKGKRDLVILEIDPEMLTSPIKYESFEGGLEVFPHVYGPINLNAVINENQINIRS